MHCHTIVSGVAPPHVVQFLPVLASQSAHRPAGRPAGVQAPKRKAASPVVTSRKSAYVVGVMMCQDHAQEGRGGKDIDDPIEKVSLSMSSHCRWGLVKCVVASAC